MFGWRIIFFGPPQTHENVFGKTAWIQSYQKLGILQSMFSFLDVFVSAKVQEVGKHTIDNDYLAYQVFLCVNNCVKTTINSYFCHFFGIMI